MKNIPQDFIDLAAEIASYTGSDGIKSKKLGELSIQYSGDSSWKSVYSNRLQTYSKMFNDFETAPARRRVASCKYM